jgi:Secretion system C-terminal sorting domain/Concanavalin A-like lectin/glucanases superfamily
MKTKLLFLVLSISNFCFAQFPTNGLVAQYGFDNGSLLVDGANGQNLTQTGTALTQINNRFGNAPTSAISLNGDYLTRPAINYPTDLSISFWIKTGTNDTNRKTIIDDKATNYGLYIFIENGKIGISASHERTPIGLPITYRTFEFISNTVVSDGQWHNITFTIEFDQIRNIANVLKGHIFNINLRTDLVLESFVDTINTNTTLQVVNNTNTNTGFVKIANNRTNTLSNNNRYFDSIDDILIYSRLLTIAEIAGISNYNNFCFTPSSTILSASTITQTTATINIAGTGAYDIAYHKTSDNFSSATIINGINSGSTNLTGLEAFTNYTVYVRGNCTNTTAWSSPINFTTTRTIGRIYVNANATGNNNGVSWTNAYTNLESALAVAQSNEEIWLTEGTYKPHASDRTIPFTISDANLKLYGGFIGNETQLSERVFGAHETILSGDLLGNDDNILSYVNITRNDNSYNIISLQANNSLFDRLTITGGHANGTFAPFKTGAGIYKSPTVNKMSLNNCKMSKNIAIETGGALIAIFNNASSELIVSNCEFTENLALGGGAIYSYTNNVASVVYTISNSLFKKNQAKDNGATMGYSGSSLWLRAYGTSSAATTNIVNCTFADNVDTGTSVGINNFNRATLVLSKRIYVNSNQTATLSNCILWNNKATGTTVSRPLSGLIDDMVSPITITNSIDETNFTGVTLSGTSANTSGTNPLFTNTASDDYTLSSGSPAIDNGNNTSIIGTTDLLNNQRILNTTVDMGAYEFGLTTLSTASFTDFTAFTVYPNPANGIVNVKSEENIENIEIFSLEGRKVKTSNVTKNDISDLSNGIYLMQIKTTDGKFGVQRIIKN